MRDEKRGIGETKGVAWSGAGLVDTIPLAKAPATGPVLPGRKGVIHRLMQGVHLRFGTRVTAAMEQAIDKSLADIPDAVLLEWIERVENRPSDYPEWNTLVEKLTVHETYFFRDPPVMELLAGQILPDLIRQRSDMNVARLSIWSAGCSTGEEPYTVAMLTLEALLAAGEATLGGDGAIRPHPRWRIEILGTDISGSAIARAEAGIYADFNGGAFRAMHEKYRGYFAPAPQEEGNNLPRFRLRENIRRIVRFRQHNLQEMNPPGGDFDIVLCRNVLIYFDDDRKQWAQMMFARALRSGGALVLGGADMMLVPGSFERRRAAGGYWYVRLPMDKTADGL